jgi:hypothetical protein
MLALMPPGLFDDVYVFSQNGSDAVWTQMGVAGGNIFKPDEQGLQQLGRIMRSDTFSRKILVVFDDVTGSRIFRTSRLYIGMHTGTAIHRISLFSLTQSYRSLSRSCRMNVSDLYTAEDEGPADRHSCGGVHEFLRFSHMTSN